MMTKTTFILYNIDFDSLIIKITRPDNSEYRKVFVFQNHIVIFNSNR